MKLSIRHRWSVGIGEDAARATMHLLLSPRDDAGQTVREWRVDAPGLDDAAGFRDAFGNRALLVTQTRPEPEIIVEASGVIETRDHNGVLGRPPGEPVTTLFLRLTPLTRPSRPLVAGLGGEKDRIALLHTLMARVGESASGGAQSQSQSGDGQGQSQTAEAPSAEDLAHAFIGAARALGLPSRYVTGYCAGFEDGTPRFHAWAESYDEGLGWIAFDPALQVCPTEHHVRVATGLDALSTAPVRAAPCVGSPSTVELTIDAAP